MTCAFVAGCDTVNVTQYRIVSAAASLTDRTQVCDVVRSVAAKTHLNDQTADSIAPGTLIFYRQPGVKHFALEIGARTVGSDITVDLTTGFGPETKEYRSARRLLGAALTQAFGPRVVESDHKHREF